MVRVFAFWLTLGLACLPCSQAFAWVSMSVNSSVTDVEVHNGGSATISHEWLIRVRGGPLKSLTIDGVDADAMLLEGATLTRAASGKVAGVPIPLDGEKSEDNLHLALAYKKGVGSGSYLLRFAYTTDLHARGLIRSAGPVAQVEWQSPQYPDGIDSLRVNFAFERGAVGPALFTDSGTLAPTSADGVQIVSTDRGVFLSELRREPSRDVLALTRPHAARFEQVTWRMRVDPKVVGLNPTSAADFSPNLPVVRPNTPTRPLWPFALAAAFAVSFGGLLFWKLRSPHSRPLIRMRLRYRLALVSALLAGSVLLALVPESPTLAALLLCSAVALSITHPRPAAVGVRGPGQWRAVSVMEIAGVLEDQPTGSKWLDMGTVPGFVFFSVLLGGFVVLGLRMLGVSPYYSAMALLYATGLVPLFCTVGRGARVSLVHEQLLFLEPLVARVPPGLGYVELVARFPTGRAEPDEVRLRCAPKNPCSGFRSCEVAVEHTEGAFGRISTPALLVRVDEHSEAHRNLPRDAQWSRGRHAEERAAVLRPALPLRAVTLELLSDVLRRVNRSARTHRAA